MTDLLLTIVGYGLALGGFFAMTLAPCVLAIMSDYKSH